MVPSSPISAAPSSAAGTLSGRLPQDDRVRAACSHVGHKAAYRLASQTPPQDGDITTRP